MMRTLSKLTSHFHSFSKAGRRLFIALLLSLAATVSAQNLELTSTPDSPQPGDLIELRATLRSPEFHKANLVLPPQEGLHLVSTQELPVKRTSQDTYESGKLWVVQALHSGPISITGLTAELSDRNTPLNGPDLTLNITPPSLTTSSQKPIPWPENNAKEMKPSAPWLLIAGAILGSALLILALKSRASSSPGAPNPKRDRLQDILTALSKGETGRQEARELLLDEGASFPPSLRQHLERTAYAPELAPEELAAELEAHSRT